MSKSLTSLVAMVGMLLGFAVQATAKGAQSNTIQPKEFNVTVGVSNNAVSGTSSDQFLSFSAPIEIPCAGLPPGTYVFHFVTPSIVQVRSQDGSKMYGTFFTTPVWRGEAKSGPTMTVERTSKQAPLRLVAWFNDGSYGVAPVYASPAVRPSSQS